MRIIQSVMTGVVVWLAMATTRAAQNDPRQERDPGAPVRLVFDEKQAFIARASVLLRNPDKVVLVSNTVAYACRAGKFRTELQPTKMSAAKNASSGESALHRSINEIVYMTCPERATVYAFYPSLKGYMEVPDPFAAFNKSRQIEKTDLGQDAVNGHPCFKRKLLVSAGNPGPRREFTVWEATDMNRFPVQVEFASGTNTVQVQFSEVQPGTPDPSLFQPPAESKYYATPDALMTGFMIQMVQEIKGLPTYVPVTPQQK